MDPEAGGHRHARAAETRRFLEVLALCSVAVTEPVLGAFGASPETFAAAGAGRLSVVAFGMGVAFGPALALWGASALVGLAGDRARRFSHLVVIGGLGALIALRVVGRTGWPRPLVAALAVAGGIVGAALVARFRAARDMLALGSVAVVALLVVFLAFSPTALLVFPPRAAAAGRFAPATAHGTGRRPPSPPSILMVVADELPTESLLDSGNRIDPDLFPNLARLAERSTWYRNTTAAATFTDAAVPAVLSGIRPRSSHPTKVQYQRNLFTLLRDTYDLNVWEEVTDLCSRACGTRPGASALRDLTDRATRAWTDIVGRSLGLAPDADAPEMEIADASGRVARLDRFIRSLRPADGRPRLDFVHVMLPHAPWLILPDGRRYETDDGYLLMSGRGHWKGLYGASLARQRHLLQLQYLDRRLGDIVAALKRIGRYDDTLIVVTADHGVSFTPGAPWRGVTRATYDQLLWVPFLLKAPHQVRGRLDETPVESIDVLPTVADEIGMHIPWPVEGRSVRRGSDRRSSGLSIYPWYQDEMPRVDGHVELDARSGYRRMLAAPPAVAPAAPEPGGGTRATSDPDRVFRLAPYGWLVGLRVEDLESGARAGWGARLRHPSRYERREAGLVPVLVTADVTGRPGGNVVVAVDGVIGGWARYSPYNGAVGVMVPPRLLGAERPRIRFYELGGTYLDPVLRPVTAG